MMIDDIVRALLVVLLLASCIRVVSAMPVGRSNQSMSDIVPQILKMYMCQDFVSSLHLVRSCTFPPPRDNRHRQSCKMQDFVPENNSTYYYVNPDAKEINCSEVRQDSIRCRCYFDNSIREERDCKIFQLKY